MQDFFLNYQLFITFLLGIFLCFSIYNLATFPKIRRRKISPKEKFSSFEKIPFVSILVPARNEEKNIRTCVESLCRQDYPQFEVIVLDDNSTDATGKILSELKENFSGKLKILQGKELPPDWVGKNWACHQLSQVARGEILLFTDADTIHGENMLSSSVIFCDENNLDFFSMIPYEIMKSWGEKLIIPIVHYNFFAYLPNEILIERKEMKYSAANGQFMFFRKSAYQKIGGHESVKNNLVEDVFLAREIKLSGLSMALTDGTEIVNCRMYENFSEAFRGFSKNFFPAMSYNFPLMILFLAQYFALYILPLIFLAYSLVFQEFSFAVFWLSLVQYLIVVIIRYIIAVRFKMAKFPTFLHPVSIAIASAIAINSVRWAYSKKGSVWKGRSYTKENF